VSGEARGRLPDFLLIGAMKSGTTTLWRHLASHPEIFMATPKEPQFFSREHAYSRGLDWYCSLFAAAAASQRCGEASACYARWPEFGGVPERIAAHVPQARLVYLIREPVARCYSHYAHEMEERALRGSGPLLGFEEAIECVPNILDASLYAKQIERYLAHFPRSALFILTLEELRASPDATWRSLQGFLGVSHVPLSRSVEAADNPAGDRFSRVTMRRTLERVRAHPVLAAALPLVPRGLRAGARRLVEQSALVRRFAVRSAEAYRANLTPMSAAARERLAERFRDDRRALERTLGRELTEWRS
jgi:hypothetical protein